MEMKFTPTLCDGVLYSGTVTIRPLSFDERLDVYEELGLSEMPTDEKAQQSFGLKMLKGIGKRSRSFVKCCEIVRVSDSYVYPDWNEVYHDSDLTSLVVEVCTKIMGKIQAGI